MSEIVEPPKNPLERLWERVPENFRLPVIFGLPALLVVAATPLLFREGSAKKRTVALETRQEGGSSRQQATNSGGVFLSRDQPAEPAPMIVAAGGQQAAPPPVSSLMRPTDGAAYAGPPLPGQVAAEAAPAPAAPAEKEGGLEESDGADVSQAGGGVDIAGMMASAGASGPKRLATQSSQFSYSGGVGNGAASGANVKKLKGFSYKKKADKAGTSIAGGANSKSTLASAGIGDSATGKNMAKDMIQQSGAEKVLSGLGMGGALGGAAGDAGAGSGGSSGAGSVGGGGGDGGVDGGLDGINASLDNAKKCKEADRIYSPQIKQASNELAAINQRRFNTLDCRNIKCTDNVSAWCGYVNKCECPSLACRSIQKCQQIEGLNCKFAQMCPVAGRPCGGSDCK